MESGTRSLLSASVDRIADDVSSGPDEPDTSRKDSAHSLSDTDLMKSAPKKKATVKESLVVVFNFDDPANLARAIGDTRRLQGLLGQAERGGTSDGTS
ncbi:uncharacterized protein LTR77_007319 [Saxophila tyrrhenica]|uniref:Uncharacterized protein n=1 Tax=Saxophila tyrrhenica TaxID=1690608 RepID=A0AAV9P8F8_9PEZI|nr:hypothetical protein LTR77_007319 [Saxophila tyrrhenica]